MKQGLSGPSHIRNRCNGLKAIVVPLLVYSDDTSGNKSRKYNCFNSLAMMLAGLPRSENFKLPNIHFLATSNKVILISGNRSEKIISVSIIQYALFSPCSKQIKASHGWKE